MKRANIASAIAKSMPKESSSSTPSPESVTPELDAMIELREYHATLMVATTMIKSFHYCIAGMGFFTIHPILGEYWNELDKIIDEVAELIVTLQGVPTLTMKEALELSCLEEHPFSGRITCKQAMTTVETAFDCLAKLSKDIAVTFDEMGDIGTSGLLGEQCNYFTKSNWMIGAYLNE